MKDIGQPDQTRHMPLQPLVQRMIVPPPELSETVSNAQKDVGEEVSEVLTDLGSAKAAAYMATAPFAYLTVISTVPVLEQFGLEGLKVLFEDPKTDLETIHAKLEDVTRVVLYKLSRMIVASPDHQLAVGVASRAVEEYMTLHPAPNFDSLVTFLSLGNVTSTKIMGQLLRIVPLVVVREGFTCSPEKLVTVARKSYPLLMKLALPHVNHLTAFQDKLAGKVDKKGKTIVFDPDSFVLTLDNDGAPSALEIRPDILASFRSYEGAHPQETPKLGCPAHVRMDGRESAIFLLWKWFTDMGLHIYRWEREKAAEIK
jgi:hypothetical protein